MLLIRFLKQILCSLGIFLGTAQIIYCQAPTVSNRQRIYLEAQQFTLCDSLSIVPHSVQFFNKDRKISLDTSFYTLQNNCILLEQSFPFGNMDSLFIEYRVLPIDLKQRYSWIDSSKINTKQQEIDIAFDFTKEETTGILPQMNGLDYQGSFERGITIGNNQSLVLNSSFNLQMAGKIANDLEIKAAITDENIPIQPEGNTQSLREFDKIFIQLNKGKSSLTAGDYELKSGNSYFLQYFKKLQGLTANSSFHTSENSLLKVKGSLAIPRGQFARNNITAIEGNQGPYSLQGNNGERFLIILSATERVFIDGKLLKRGIDEDYVIDYNRGSLTFTPQVLITKDRRIIVEFEYADQRFQKRLMAIDLGWNHKKGHVFFNFITQQDSKLTGGAQDLSKAEKLSLANAGDDLSQAIVSGIDTIENFNVGQIAYELIDTLGFTEVLKYSQNKSKTLFKARFSEVGLGNGSYVISQDAVNGRVYEWIAPAESTGLLQGNFAPVRPLVAPKQQQIFTLGSETKILKNLFLKTEMSLSNTDLNRFSEKDKSDNVGLAAKVELTHKLALSKKKHPALLATNISYEWVASQFKTLNPFRQPEFVRDWNLNGLNTTGAEILPNISVSYIKPNWGDLQYYFSGYTKKGLYEGNKHGLSFQLNRGRVRWNSKMSLLTSVGNFERSRFSRPNSDLSISILNKWGVTPGRIGIAYEHEENKKFTQVAHNQIDTLSRSSQRFDFYKLYFELPSRKKIQSGFFISKRLDYSPGHIVHAGIINKFIQSTDAIDVAWKGLWVASRSSRLNWQFSRRQLDIIQKKLTVLKPQNTWLGKLDYRFKIKKGLLVSSTTYELGSGQTPKLEYNYLKVDPGQGSFTWIDRNVDTIAQINEFEIAPFSDQADYIRVSIVTNDFVATNNIRLNQSIRINPKEYLVKRKGFLNFIGKISSISSIRIFKRLLVEPNVEAWNPFAERNDTAIVTTQTAIINTLFFNKGNPNFEFQLGQKSNKNKSLLTSGGSVRSRFAYFSKMRYRIHRTMNLNLELEQANQISHADLFENRNFNLIHKSGKIAITHIQNRRLRNILSYRTGLSRNLEGMKEELQSHEFRWEFTFTGKPQLQSTKRPLRFRANFSVIKNNFLGETGSTVGFTMLQGLQSGQNLLWGMTIDKQLTKSVILSILYNGRQTGEGAKLIHVGSMQARALF